MLTPSLLGAAELWRAFDAKALFAGVWPVGAETGGDALMCSVLWSYEQLMLSHYKKQALGIGCPLLSSIFVNIF